LRLGGPDPAARILAALDDPEESVRTMAFIELGDHLDLSMLPLIERRLQDADAIVRQRAAEYRDRLSRPYGG
jgi:HEAT repeat protein